MNKKFQNFILLALMLVATGIVSVFSIKEFGMKDGATVALSFILLVAILYISVKDIKRAIYLFIISMPILVTARKAFYVDFFIMKLNFETIIIMFLFIIKFKSITSYISGVIHTNKRVKIFVYVVSTLTLGSFVSVLFSSREMDSIRLTVTSILVPILLLLIVMSQFQKSDIKNIVYAMILSINLSCLYGFIQAAGLGSLSVIKSSKEYLTFGYHNTNIFVNIALMVFPFTVNELLYKKKTKKELIFLVISFLIQSVAIFITFSRGAWLALVIITVAIMFSKKYKYVFLAIFIVAIVASPFLLPKILARGSSDVSFLQNTSNSARVQSIATSMYLISHKPFGVGFGQFNPNYREHIVDGYMLLSEKIRYGMEAPLYSLENAHNYFLHIGVELGVLSLISIILINIMGFIEGIRKYSDNRACIISLAMFLFIGITTGIEFNHKGVLTNTYLYWILFGLIYLGSSDVINKKIEN